MQSYKINGIDKAPKGFPMSTCLLMDMLQEHVEADDFISYEWCVNYYAPTLNEIGSCFWLKLFSRGDRKEILFWINTPLRRLSLKDLSVITVENEDLFQIGIARLDLDLDYAEFAIEMFKEEKENREIYQNRIEQIRKLMKK
jgi:hypothetical protein